MINLISIQWSLGLLLFLSSFFIWAQEEQATAEYVGSEECQDCHKRQYRTYVGGKHGKVFARHPTGRWEGGGCESCHGPGSRHIQIAGELDYSGPLLIRNFKNPANADESSNVCLGCHENNTRLHWQNGGHAMAGVSCTACHTIHSEDQLPTMEACLNCHKSQRAKLQRSSHMPIRERRITCMDCHNPHGGTGPGSLKVASVNETCYQCHAEKRGPNIFEHPPVRDNCAICHDPHGSSNAKLLKKKVPYLCQQCHSVRGHPSTLYDGADLNDAAVRQLRGKGCINCHSNIHGSNHPSGARFQR